MDRKQRIEMILRVLLCPFLELPAHREDLLCAKTKAYHRIVTSGSNAISNKDAYERARVRLEHWMESHVRPERLSEMESLLEMYYPLEELRAYLIGEGQDDLDGYYIQVLFQLAVEFITLRDGQISIRMWDEPEKDRYFQGSSGLYKVELWSILSRIMTPDVLIAAYFVSNGIDNVQQLARIPDNLSLCDTLMAGVARRGIAETHMHLSAGMSYLAVWQVVTDPAAQRMFPVEKEPILQTVQRNEQKAYSTLLISGWLRLLIARYLEDDSREQEDLYDYYMAKESSSNLEQHILHYVLEGYSKDRDGTLLYGNITKHGREYMSHLAQICPIQREELDVLLRGPYSRYSSLYTEPELLLLYFSLQHIRNHPRHRQFTRIFLNYIRIKNSYFRDKIQTFGGGGLAFFSRYFQEASSAIWRISGEDRKKEQLVYQTAFRNQLHCTNLRKLEVKISPQIYDIRTPKHSLVNGEIQKDKRAIARQLSQVFSAYLQVCKEQPDNVELPCLGIVYHFIKSDVHHPKHNGCWVTADRIDGPTDEVSLLRMQCIRFLRALRMLIQEVPLLDGYVVGLDAANQELWTDPWVYAPVYRFARNRENTLPLNPQSGLHMQSIGLTYHVGEDYHHILTGLRHIDEVITYFGYKAGDRLGHAMALQVDLDVWVHAHETVPVPGIDRLEDLLWLWALCEECPEELGKYRFEIEGKLMKLAVELLKNSNGLSPYVLWHAYTKKFKALDPNFCKTMKAAHLHQNAHSCSQLSLESQRPFCQYAIGREQSWDVEKLLLTHYCPIYTRHYKKPILISTLPEDIPMLWAVQRHIRKKVQDMGVYVETNPTSNVSIGDISSLRDYPITQLNTHPLPEPNPMSILLSINSDDPLVFNTNVENELALVYHTLTYRGYGREQVLDWIDKVRQYGIDSSFIRKGKDSAHILCEIESILYSLDQAMKRYPAN